MKVFAVGGKAFFHKDTLKDLGFRWFREPKLWVKPVSLEASASGLEAKLNAMEGVRWDVQDLPVEGMFRQNRPAKPANAQSGVSSLDRARAAAAKARSAPASNLAVVEAGPQEDEADDLEMENAKADDQVRPEYVRLKGRIKAVRLMLDEMEQDLEALHRMVER